MRLILSAALIAACWLLGALYASSKKDSLRTLAAACGLLRHMGERISVSNDKLGDIIASYGDTRLPPEFFGCFAAGVRRSISGAWGGAVMSLRLPPAAEEIMLEAGEGLGLVSRKKQTELLASAEVKLSALYGSLSAEYDKKSRSYRALGALIGALAVIIVI